METRMARTRLLSITALLFVGLLCSCSINQLAVRAVGGMLAGSGASSVFTGDEDPQLVGDALPFAMKVYESLLEQDPQNAPLALATGRAFVSYAFAFVQAPSDILPPSQGEEQRAMRQRAKKLFLRARDYVLRGLEVRRPGFTAALNAGSVQAALKLTNEHYLRRQEAHVGSAEGHRHTKGLGLTAHHIGVAGRLEDRQGERLRDGNNQQRTLAAGEGGDLRDAFQSPEEVG
jgi:hypothetical protein